MNKNGYVYRAITIEAQKSFQDLQPMCGIHSNYYHLHCTLVDIIHSTYCSVWFRDDFQPFQDFSWHSVVNNSHKFYNVFYLQSCKFVTFIIFHAVYQNFRMSDVTR